MGVELVAALVGEGAGGIATGFGWGTTAGEGGLVTTGGAGGTTTLGGRLVTAAFVLAESVGTVLLATCTGVVAGVLFVGARAFGVSATGGDPWRSLHHLLRKNPEATNRIRTTKPMPMMGSQAGRSCVAAGTIGAGRSATPLGPRCRPPDAGEDGGWA